MSTPPWRSTLGLGISSIKGEWESSKAEAGFLPTLSTVCLLCTLFKDLGCAIELQEKLANEVTELHSLDLRNYLFNGHKEGDYLLGQGIVNEGSSDDKEYLQLYTCSPRSKSLSLNIE